MPAFRPNRLVGRLVPNPEVLRLAVVILNPL